ncbi:xanthine dehydrogenase family protein molybdopterin-binding subunit [Aquabacterium sp.]|uniref:xanthine dehydrogenase family protein molybdopterin-binding subunit n=1 Tax=Aquabacterium sp. TaxID=1872578 RepID=UPI0037843D2A
MATTRQEERPTGIGGATGTVTREVPADEPPPWPANDRLRCVGQAVPRHDGRAKVTGQARYTVDVRLPGLLHARMLRSPHAHARVRRLDLSRAAQHPGVRGVLALVEPGNAARDRLRYVGAPVAAVAAVDVATAEQALRLIAVDYEPLPHVVELDAARAASAPRVYDEGAAPGADGSGYPARPALPIMGNVRGPSMDRRGDVAAGFAQADVVVEAEYRTQVQTHCCLEPHAVVADWRDDGLTIHISTQYTAGVRREAAQAFGLPLAKVRVVVQAMGGGFGSKSSLGAYGRVAVQLSRQVGAPVRLVLSREEEQLDTGNRPGTWQRLRLGARRDGTLTAIALTSYGTAGIGLGAGVGNVAEALYSCPHFEGAQHDVFTHGGPGSPMRAPGNVQGAWAMEQAIDELADRLGLDPLALRERIDPSPVRREERRIGAERIGWARRHAPGADPGPVKRGIGVAQSIWGANIVLNAACEVRIARDGSVQVASGVQDIGTGIGTVLAQVVAEELGLAPQDIDVRIGDTDLPPGPPSYGSLTTASITPAARTAAWRALRTLARTAAPVLQAAPDELVARDGRLAVRGDAARSMSFAEAAARLPVERISEVASRSEDYGGFRQRFGDMAQARQDLGGVQFAEVAVDTETGLIRVERVVAVQDCGRPINARQIESQVQGGVLMGLGFALLEERVMDRASGRMLNADLAHYRCPGAADVPRIDVVVLENYQGRSATDAYGIAEPANIATAAAIGNAVFNAIGVRLRETPMRPATVLAALATLGRLPAGR